VTASAGLLLDRYISLPLLLTLPIAVVALAAWPLVRRRHAALPLTCLGLAVLALAAARHHQYRDTYRADDIGARAAGEPRPAHVRGVLEEEPLVLRHAAGDALRLIPDREPDPSDAESGAVRPGEELRSLPGSDASLALLGVTDMRAGDDWLPVSGRARLIVAGRLEDVHVGDEVDVIGLLSAPPGPANPGEFDQAAHFRDQRVRAQLVVHKTRDGVVRLTEGWPRSLKGWLAVAKGWGQRALRESLPEEQAGLAQALLLGRGSDLTTEDWDRYVRAGVVHVLVVSGLHVAFLGWVLWLVLRLLGVRRRHGAWVVAGILLGYALLTGAGTPVLRAALTTGAFCGGIILRRPVQRANVLALVWLLIALLEPTDLFSLGCQLTFLAVILLTWGPGRWLRREADALERLAEKSRPAWQRGARWLGRIVMKSYAITCMVWLAQAPLLAAGVHVITPEAPLLGPPVMLLAGVGLVSGFLLLLANAVCWPLVPVFAVPTSWSLSACDWLVSQSLRLPGASWYVGDIPQWWLWVFCVGLVSFLLLPPLQRRWGWALVAGAGWLCLGLLAGMVRPPSNEMRCTFLAVGHGGCTVLETPDGRVLLYDAGALAGPDVTRRQIAPYLWSRGIRRIDEVFLSHADKDHFNGVPALLDRFAVGQLTYTPSFREKPTAAVHVTLDALQARGVPVRSVTAGDWLTAGDVQIEVLHPPEVGPDGNENTRSLVLLVRHAGHSILLTGDLEGAGLNRVLALPAAHVDVLMAPHHGSRIANTPALAAWARPRVVVACQGPPQWPSHNPEPYTAAGAQFLGTWPHGAVTVRSHRTGLVVETFTTGQRIAVRPEGPH
jgi:competence protein ComEC